MEEYVKLAKQLLSSKEEKIIIKGHSIKDEFDDIGFGECGFWARICQKHAKMKCYTEIGNIIAPYPGDKGICDCKNCWNRAVFYIDFFNDSPELQAIFGCENR